jgi:pSer/pThr/pTyr-binding forkhead associated (FHA) protein
MPLIRCTKCGQAYDVPGAVAVHLSNAIATCHCGEWLAGSKAAVLARLMNPEDIREIDLQPYKVDTESDPFPEASGGQPPTAVQNMPPGSPRSIRVIARSNQQPFNRVFTIGKHPMWIGKSGCHVNLDGTDLDIRHASIYLSGDQLIVRDADSHTGTFLDGQRVTETVLPDGEHVLRIGGAMMSVETTGDSGVDVVPIMNTEKIPALSEAEIAAHIAAKAEAASPKRSVLVCIDGPLNGQEFEIPPTGLVVGREGHVRVPDEYLSRKHFEVLPDNEGAIRVRDLGSRNGTFLNTLPASNTKVHAGDEIRAGTNRFRIEQRS